MVVVPLDAAWGGRGDPLWDPDGLEAGLQGSEVSGDEALLPKPAVGLAEEAEETAGERGLLAGEGGRKAGGVGDAEGEEPAEEDRRSGRFWLDERRLFRTSCSPAAIFLLSLRRLKDESSISPSSYFRAICNTHTERRCVQ